MELTPERLRELAQAASSGPWDFTEDHWQADLRDADGNQIAVCAWSDDPDYDEHTRADFRFIAALPPERVLLLAELWEAAQEAERDPQHTLRANEPARLRLRDVLARLSGANEESA